MNDAIKMQISAFVDGELPENESQLLLRRLCQDIELRQQAAEYFTIGRTLRGQRRVPGIEKLRARIAAAIDDKSLQDEFDAIEPAERRYLRPLAGVAIAATVALAAILGFQQLNGNVDTEVTAANRVAEELPEQPGYTVPDIHREQHNMESGNLDALFATFELREVDMDESDARDDDASSSAVEDIQDLQTP
ncbi:MAG: sigma-E factor negative regulatory protein [Gammaproteobacteria bacterium]|nr:sigma-E factor negative regulatory protein [Gammaproteobacteria bacterium]